MNLSIHNISCKSDFHQVNEDSFSIGDNYIIVADGMGGESSGEEASRIAVETIAQILNNGLDNSSQENIKDFLFSAIKQADLEISKFVCDNPDSDGMGTTILITVIRDDIISIAWCGDSRCYSYANGNLRSVTKDHSYVQSLIDSNIISVEESFFHPDNNLLTKYVGGGEMDCEPEYVEFSSDGLDILILCSDGLSGYCKDAEIEKVVSSNKDISLLPTSLKKLAISHGSDDDITIVTCNFQSKMNDHKWHSLWNRWRKK